MPGRREREAEEEERAITSLTATGDARYFLRWFPQSQFRMMEAFLDQLDHVPGRREHEVLKQRFRAATTHGAVVLWIRFTVTALLVLAGGSTLVSTMLGLVDVVPGARETVTTVAAVASGLTVVLIVLRLMLDRHLERIRIYLTFIGMQIAGQRARRAGDERDADDAAGGDLTS